MLEKLKGLKYATSVFVLAVIIDCGDHVVERLFGISLLSDYCFEWCMPVVLIGIGTFIFFAYLKETIRRESKNAQPPRSLGIIEEQEHHAFVVLIPLVLLLVIMGALSENILPYAGATSAFIMSVRSLVGSDVVAKVIPNKGPLAITTRADTTLLLSLALCGYEVETGVVLEICVITVIITMFISSIYASAAGLAIVRAESED